MKRIIIGVAAAVALSSLSASATTLWKGDFETGNLSQWSELEGLATRISPVASPVREGRFAARFELRNGDYSNGGCRNELDYAPLEGEGSERYYGWSTMFDASYPSANTWQVFTQWHHTGLDGSPPVEFDVQGEQIMLLTGGDKQIWAAPLARGTWHDFVLHVVWSSSSSTGLLELWYDGARVLPATHMATLYAGQQVYLKQGLYRDASIQPTAVVFHDGMTVGTAFADVAPAGTPPPPPPPAPDAGTPAADAGTPVADAGTADAGSVTPPSGAADAGVPAPEVATSFPGITPGGGCSSVPLDTGAAFAVLCMGLALRRRRSS